MHRLSIVEAVSGAVLLVGESRKPLLRALILPATMLSALDVANARIENESWLYSGAYLLAYYVVYSVFAVSCNRIILLGDSALPNRWGWYFTSREARFFGWSLAVGLIALPALLAAGLLVGVMMAFLPENALEPWFSNIAYVAGSMPGYYVMARASLVLPATAIDERPTMSRSWRLTKNNGWRLVLILAIPVVVLSSIHWFLESVIGPTQSLLWSIFVTFGICLFGVFEVAVLSVTFKLLGGFTASTTAA